MAVDPFSIDPFGKPACEKELAAVGKDEYLDKLYQPAAEFITRSASPHVYLMPGRRGAGKTALAQYLSVAPPSNPKGSIYVDQDALTVRHLRRIGAGCDARPAEMLPRISNVWRVLLWSIAMGAIPDPPAELRIELASLCRPRVGSWEIFQPRTGALRIPLPDQESDDQAWFDWCESLLKDPHFEKARELAARRMMQSPITLIVDTSEQYDTRSDDVMYALAGLIEAGSHIEEALAERGFYIKLFFAEEIFPKLEVAYVSNTSKHVRNPVKIRWRPKELLRLAAWRLLSFKSEHGYSPVYDKQSIDWTRPSSIYERFWSEHFGEKVLSRSGNTERTFSYILRHTQLRPRQMIVLCNRIAQASIDQCEDDVQGLKNFSGDSIRFGVQEAEIALAKEIINSYRTIFPKASLMINCLTGGTPFMQGNELHIAFNRARAFIPEDPDFDHRQFIDMLVQLGVIGRIRRQDNEARIVEADFQHNMDHELRINERDQCIVHPMFCSFLNRSFGPGGYIVYPFPEHPDYSRGEGLI